MDFILNNSTEIIMVISVLYPPALFLLPPTLASKIDLGIKVFKVVADGLERAKNTKPGLSNQFEETENKKPIQKSRN